MAGLGSAISGIADVFKTLPPTSPAKFSEPPAPWIAGPGSATASNPSFASVKTNFFDTPSSGGSFDPTGFFGSSGGGGNSDPTGFFAGGQKWGSDPTGFFNVPGFRTLGAGDDPGNTPGKFDESLSGGTGASSSLGGDWGGVDQWTPQIEASAKKWGVDPNMVKALMKLESNGNPNAGGAPGVVGVMQVYTNVWGDGPWNTDTAANIDKGTQILKEYLDGAGGDYYEALRGYHGYGSDGYTTDREYADIVMANYNQLNQAGGNTDGNNAQVGPRQTGTTSAAGNSIVNLALQYVGTPYTWGGIPGKGDDPRATGWDCSGMTYWLDQNYGGGQLPMGSHYQYQYAQQTGQLFNNTAQLQPGDLVFWDTGNYEGGGAELNNAGHVGIYIGDGKMLHAANPDAGTIVSDFNQYLGMYTFLGAMHSSYSGGAAGAVPGANNNAQTGIRPAGQQSIMPTSWGGGFRIGGGGGGGSNGFNIGSFSNFGQRTGWL